MAYRLSQRICLAGKCSLCNFFLLAFYLWTSRPVLCSFRRKQREEQAKDVREKTSKIQKIKNILPFVVQNTGRVAGNGDGGEATSKVGQRGGAESKRIWLNSPLVGRF